MQSEATASRSGSRLLSHLSVSLIICGKCHNLKIAISPLKSLYSVGGMCFRIVVLLKVHC